VVIGGNAGGGPSGCGGGGHLWPRLRRRLCDPQEVRPLPGGLDTVPVFNSNSPELVLEPGILLSTFPLAGMAHPDAHLDYALSGRFDIFAHHVARAPQPDDLTSLYLGIVVHNPGAGTRDREHAPGSQLPQPARCPLLCH
jgi:hypothetical protein